MPPSREERKKGERGGEGGGGGTGQYSLSSLFRPVEYLSVARKLHGELSPPKRFPDLDTARLHEARKGRGIRKRRKKKKGEGKKKRKRREGNTRPFAGLVCACLVEVVDRFR